MALSLRGHHRSQAVLKGLDPGACQWGKSQVLPDRARDCKVDVSCNRSPFRGGTIINIIRTL